MKRILKVAAVLASTVCAAAAPGAGRPHVLLILADDLGYQDTGCYGATKIRTPRIDRLAAEGVRFTDAHSTAAVCNPTRYSILSGTYLWHAKRKPDYSLYFHDGQVTLPSLLKGAGYRTAALGKWHNGFGRGGEPDWNGELKPGPMEIGFDSFFGTPRTHNEPPLVFVDGRRVVGLDPADPISMDYTQGPHGAMRGGAQAQAARPDERIDFILAEKAAAFLARQTKEAPFFLYLAFAAPHVPINPAPEFRGKSEAGRYGDYVQQLDHCTGLVLDALEKQGLAGNTLVIFTSDNGAVYHADALAAGHRANGALLGQKTDAWEGGHRVPLIARWPGQVPPGTVRRALFSQVDLMATIAEAAGIALPAGASPDGAGELAAFTDPDRAPARRTEAVFLGTGGHGLRQGPWTFLPKRGSGGMTVQDPAGKPWGQPYAKLGLTNSDVGASGRIKPDAPAAQLYNLDADPGQARNLAREEPARAEAMRARLEALVGKPKAPTAMPATKAAARPAATNAPPIAVTPAPTLEDVPYGPHPKQVLHFWKAETDRPAPLLYFIHGGGWVAGDRLSGLANLLPDMLKEGISVVSVEYRFIAEARADGVEPPVRAPLHDAARALQFVRSKAAEWNIDPRRIAASGGSAGACSSLWLAFHDDLADPGSPDPVARQSTRLLCAAVTGAQTTLDPAEMKAWTPNSRYGGHAFGLTGDTTRAVSGFQQFLEARERILPWIREYSPYALVSPDDPPVFLFYKDPPALGQDQKDPTHTANFGVKLQEKVKAAGVACELVYPGAPGVKHATVRDYLIAVLKGP